MVDSIGKGWISVLVTSGAATLLSRLSTIQISYSTYSSTIRFPLHDGLVSFLNFV